MKNLYIIFYVVVITSYYALPQNPGLKNHSLTNSTPVIYVPGIMGSPLYDDLNNNNQLVADEKAWFGLQFPSLWLASNGVDPAGNFNVKVAPLRNDSQNNLRNELNSTPLDLFKGFFDNLESNGYVLDDYDDDHNENENLFCFTYDWRKNNLSSAGSLSNFIDSVRSWTGSEKVNLVGHSMGGIVAKTCIKYYDKSRIENLIFIGTPHLGAPEMLTVMLKGRLFDWLNLYIEELTIRWLARNLPACYQLIPSFHYFDLSLNNSVSTDIEIYSECFQLPNGNYTNYSEMINYLRNYSSSLGEDLNDGLLDDSEIFKTYIDTVDFGNIKVFNIVGYNNFTIGKNQVQVGPPPLNWITINYYKNLNGDFTVPVRSAELINNRIFEHTFYIPDVIHSSLPGCTQTLEILLGIFSDPQITNFPQYSSPPLSYKDIVTKVNDENEIPAEYHLTQNYPNPFNPKTIISYQLPISSEVILKIFDVLGNEVATLVSEYQPAGVYEIEWNSSNYPSGIYFYKLFSGNFVVTKKMVLMK